MPRKKAARSETGQSNYERARRLGLRYVGRDGAHLTGIPAADIAPDRVALIGPFKIDAVMASGLYELNEEKANE